MSETMTVAVETPRLNKSSLIRDAFKKLGLKAPANDVINVVKETAKVDVNDGLVNLVRKKLKNNSEAKKKARATANGKSAETTVVTPVSTPTDDPLLMVASLARKLGGLAALKNAIVRLEELAV